MLPLPVDRPTEAADPWTPPAMPHRLPHPSLPSRRCAVPDGPRQSPASRIVAAVAILVAIFTAVPTAAHARTYEIRQCNDGAGHAVEVTPGFVSVWENRTASDGCPGAGTLSFTMPNNTLAPFGTDGQRMGYSFTLPSTIPNAKIMRAEAQLTVPPMTGDATYSWGDLSLHVDGPQLMLDSFGPGSWGGLPNVNRSANIPGGSRFARFLVYCYGPCHFQWGPSMSMGSVVITIDDPLPPDAPVFEPSGLLDGTVQKGARKLRYAASDADSGVKRIELRTAAGIQLASTTDGQGCSYTRPIPCPQERYQEEFTLDTTRLTDGKHTLELWVTDAAGTQRKTALAPITVQNAAVPVATATPVSTATPGVIPTPTPKPSTGTTGATGTVGEPGTAGGSGSGSTPPVIATTAVAFQVSSKAPRRGVRVIFSGTVTPVPASAGRVMIEAKSKGKWITAAVVRTREGGAFVWNHTFSRRGTYTMRARLLTSVESKTKPATSAKRTFRVR